MGLKLFGFTLSMILGAILGGIVVSTLQEKSRPFCPVVESCEMEHHTEGWYIRETTGGDWVRVTKKPPEEDDR